MPYVTERQPYGPDCLVFEIGGKQFCLLDLTGKHQFFTIKADPDYSLELQAHYASVRPGFHCNKKHWISVDFNGDVPDSLQLELLRDARDIVFRNLPKKIRETLV